MRPPMSLRDLPDEVTEASGRILDAALEVHRALGRGLLESAYRDCLAYETRRRGLRVEVEHPLPLVYKDSVVPTAFRADLLVAGSIVVELKCVDRIIPEHEAQLFACLRASGCRLGILLDFHAPRIRDGLRRLIL